MMETTTPEAGPQGQPEEEAVTTGHNADQVIVTDEQGTPSLVPVTSQSEVTEAPTEEAAPAEEQAPEEEAQAPEVSVEDLDKFAKAKGFDPAALTDGERKALEMARNAEKRMHEATSSPKPTIQPPEAIEFTGEPAVDQIVERQNVNELRMYVRDWFDANPDMKDHREELAQITRQRPWLVDMDDVKAHFLANPSREAKLKSDGGREALTNLAQKQQQIPPGANATNSGVYASSEVITPTNVYDLVDKHDQAWFEKNHSAISKAMSGK